MDGREPPRARQLRGQLGNCLLLRSARLRKPASWLTLPGTVVQGRPRLPPNPDGADEIRKIAVNRDGAVARWAEREDDHANTRARLERSRRGRRSVGFVFQETHLFSHLSVAANIAYGLKRSGRRRRRYSLDQVVDILDLGGLLNRAPTGLSDGERQRVAIARAVLTSPLGNGATVQVDVPVGAFATAVRVTVDAVSPASLPPPTGGASNLRGTGLGIRVDAGGQQPLKPRRSSRSTTGRLGDEDAGGRPLDGPVTPPI